MFVSYQNGKFMHSLHFKIKVRKCVGISRVGTELCPPSEKKNNRQSIKGGAGEEETCFCRRSCSSAELSAEKERFSTEG